MLKILVAAGYDDDFQCVLSEKRTSIDARVIFLQILRAPDRKYMDIQTLVLSVILLAAVLAAQYVRQRKISGKGYFDGVKDRQMIDAAIERLYERFKRPYPRFETPDEVLSILERDPDSEYGMNIFLQAVAAHCSVDRKAVMLRIFEPQKGMPPGRITKLGSSFLMELYVDHSSLFAVMAVIIHEFCHFYLDECGLAIENSIENEVLTDTAAVFFGFGRQLRKGYEPRVVRSSGGRDEWYRIGYLDTLNIDYVAGRLAGREQE